MVTKIVLLSAVNPYPPDSGKAMVLAGLLRHFRERVDARNIHYLHVGSPIQDLEPFQGINVVEMGIPSRREQLVSVAVNAGLRGRSLQETFTASERIAQRISTELERLAPDLEVVDTVRMAQLVRTKPTGHRVVYFDDLFSVRYERMLDVLDSGADMTGFDPLGQFGSFIPKPLQSLTRHPVSQRILLRSEARRVRRAEIRVARDPDVEVGILLNENEARELRSWSGSHVEVIPVSMDITGRGASTWDGRPEFIFIGLLSIAHNHDGLMSFLEEGMPRLLELQPDAVLHVVGRGVSEELRARCVSFGEHVVLHGFVPDLDEVLESKCALVNPLRFGSGVKIKTLDALGRGIPVVASSFGAEGVAATSVPGLVITKGARAAAEALAELADPARRATEAEGAQRLFDSRFSPAAVAASYDRVFHTGG